jgi:hypothetical protein
MSGTPHDPTNSPSAETDRQQRQGFFSRPSETAAPAPVPTTVEPPGWGLSPLYLFLKPSSFFSQYLPRLTPAVILIATYAFGVGAVIDQLAERAMRSQLGGSESIWSTVGSSWLGYWLVCLVGGGLSGAVVWYLGGWWYRKRLQWSGAKDADAGLARKVYVFASLVYAIPLLLYTLWETVSYVTPAEAFAGDDPWALLVLVFVFWSVVVSYLGVRTMFAVRAWPSRIWFLILPSGLHAVSLIVMVGLMLLGGALIQQEPDLDEPASLEESAIALHYPGNWSVDRTGRPQQYAVAPFLDDAAFNVFIYDFPLDTLEASMETLDRLSEDAAIGDMQAIDRWGSFDGKGFDLLVTMQGSEYRATTFSVTYRSVSFEIVEIVQADAAERLAPGFELIRDSFVFRPEGATSAALR